tara:strand:- start:2658 stop:4316 length:1659 start_codon:yes stop_codon:yes gene_type:complete
MTNKKNTFQSIFLISIYIIILILVFPTFKDHGVHIEEKFHRLNGLFWLNYVSKFFNFETISLITEKKILEISGFTLNKAGSYMDKYGVVLDLPAALIEIFFNLEKIENIYYVKQFMSFVLFLISSYFFFKILDNRFKNFFLSLTGMLLFVTSPRIFGDSFLYKDVLFLSFFVIALYFFLKLTDKISKRDLIFFSLFCAVSFNLRVFAIFLPITFLIFLILNNLDKRKIFNNLKIFLLFFFVLLFFTILLSPYLWTNTFTNLIDIFRPLERASIGDNIKILFNNEFYPNRNLPQTYLFTWIAITTPIITLLLFIFGYLTYAKRFLKRFISIEEKQIFNDLWRGKKEIKDFIIFLLLTSFVLTLLIFNSPFYNGWRLVYFLNIFIIYFSIFQIHNLIIYFRNNIVKKKLLKTLVLISVLHNIVALISHHPFQSYYFTELISENKKNVFEGDYYGLSGKHFFLKLNSEYKNEKIKVAVASHTPLHRSLEGIELNIRKKFNVIGQNYENADFIYKNNISEVNSRLNKKYDIPSNFVKIYELNINGIRIYEIFKNIK